MHGRLHIENVLLMEEIVKLQLQIATLKKEIDVRTDHKDEANGTT